MKGAGLQRVQLPPGAGAAHALAEMRVMMAKLKLTVNETKTRVCHLPEEKFDFLGYTFGRCYSMRRGRVYLGTAPSKKRVQRICRAISDETGRDKVWQDSKTIALGVHCRASIGRSSVLAASVLVRLGWDANEAFSAVESARGCSIPDTPEQRQWVIQNIPATR